MKEDETPVLQLCLASQATLVRLSMATVDGSYSTYILPTSAEADSAWHHTALVYLPAGLWLYRDGQEVFTTSTVAATIPPSNASLSAFIGGMSWHCSAICCLCAYFP